MNFAVVRDNDGAYSAMSEDAFRQLHVEPGSGGEVVSSHATFEEAAARAAELNGAPEPRKQDEPGTSRRTVRLGWLLGLGLAVAVPAALFPLVAVVCDLAPAKRQCELKNESELIKEVLYGWTHLREKNLLALEEFRKKTRGSSGWRGDFPREGEIEEQRDAIRTELDALRKSVSRLAEWAVDITGRPREARGIGIGIFAILGMVIWGGFALSSEKFSYYGRIGAVMAGTVLGGIIGVAVGSVATPLAMGFSIGWGLAINGAFYGVGAWVLVRTARMTRRGT